MNTVGSFRFHSVGQGLFYSGIISSKIGKRQKTFSFVYDCGTESPKKYLYQEVDSFKLLLPPLRHSGVKKLDLLVISHLHDDHVNGLEYLLQNVEVETVVIPYADEGVLLASRLDSNLGSEFLNDFYIDPIAWFSSRGVRRIFVIGTDEEELRKREIPNTPRFNFEREDFKADWERIIQMENVDQTEIAYLSNESTFRLNDQWIFEFENLEIDRNKMRAFIQTVELFKQTKGVSLEQIFKSKSLLNSLKRETKKVFSSGKAINRTSTVMLHSPIIGARSASVYFNASPFCQLLKHINWDVGPSSLLTGDIELLPGEKLSIVNKHGILSNPGYTVIQYPHHGSATNKVKYFEKLQTEATVISYGITNKYGHPDAKNVASLVNPIFVNERNSFDYDILIQD